MSGGTSGDTSALSFKTSGDSCRSWLESCRAEGDDMCPVLAPALPERPYPGIEAFDYADHAVFFARDEESDRLLRQVTVYRGVLVYGPSGAGKSSLINAGFVPRAL